ncbi:alpha-(1,6)-fucosyltransferase-like [Ctenocephalides felis]|nr:alpha-(1,6)-fucosyltransferase-like [Ctenocephalides felis]
MLPIEYADKIENNKQNQEVGEPSIEYEMTRRQIKNNIKELWNYISNELGQLHKASTINREQIVNSLVMVANNKWWLLSDVEKLAKYDGFNNWREQESRDLSDLVQRRFHYLQNPKDCNTAKKLVCNLNKGCGFGCQLHHVAYCFIIAYGTERTLILNSKGWRYHKAGWEEVFLPLSETCRNAEGTTHGSWPGKPSTQVITLPIIDSISPRPPFLPLAVPEDLADRLARLHGDPIVWWIGQILKYLLRPTKNTEDMIKNGMDKLGYAKPIVGIHVRRTDKVGTEAALHKVAEYMTHVEDWYKQREMSEKVVRRVYVATDDPTVIEEIRQDYPDYIVIGDPSISRSASVASRYSDESLRGIVLDIILLARSDHLVCTFSSQVCRVAYEIMQTMHTDASDRFYSLDDIYYYGGQSSHTREAVLPHEPVRKGELHLKPGDIIGVAGNHWDGFSKGTNFRTSQLGLFPSFKVRDVMHTARFPTYPNVKLK